MENKIGEVKIADDVVSAIASIAASEIDGIAGVSPRLNQSIRGIVSGITGSRGVKAVIDEQNAEIELHVKVKYGVNIPEICVKIQQNVKQAIENMTGLNVTKIDVIVSDVAFSPREDTAEKER